MRLLLFIYSIFSDEEGEEDLFNKEEGVDDEKGNLTTKGLVLVDKDEQVSAVLLQERISK